MAKDKKEKGKKGGGLMGTDTRKPKHSLDTNRPSKGVANQRDAATTRRLKMYKQRAVRDKNGKLISQELQSKDLPSTRIQPDRRWFGNTRVVGQKQLEQFRTEMASKVNDSYTVLLREKKLPLQLLEDPEKKLKGKQVRSNLLATQPFKDTFGPNTKRKRPKLSVDNIAELSMQADERDEKFDEAAPEAEREQARRGPFEKGQSKRIWGELYKVLDSSDVIIQVLDARDPLGTRCRFLEQHIRKHLRHKHILLLLNKCDLVPSWVTKRWLHYLSRDFPTLAFHASITNPFGKGALLSLLRQLARLRSDKQAISVGFVGYPNVGKSSVINTLRTKKVCKTAPVPGETKIWQYITLMKRVFLIDCPGVVYNRTHDEESNIVLKGVVRVENLEDATEHVPTVLQRVKPEYLRRAYKLKEWSDCEDFLTQLAQKAGKLLKGGEPDLNTAARMVLYDWQRGKIPYFTLPPDYKPEEEQRLALAAEAAVDEETRAELPAPTNAVTEEDAQREAGVVPETAAAAAREANKLLSAAGRQQARSEIPVQDGYFMPDDERKEEQHEAGDGSELDLQGSDSGSESAGDDDGDDQGSQGQGSSSSSDEGESEGEQGAGTSGASGSDAEEQEALRQSSKGGRQRRKTGRARSAPLEQEASGSGRKTSDDGDEEGDDEDAGYGAGGLSWEAVLQCMQGGGDADATEEGAAGKKSGKRKLDVEVKEQQQQQQPSGKKNRKSKATSGKSKMATLE
ncbi:NUC091 domain-containing protein [Dunaliella salina]|uniref:Nuclear/nucleolar GTPase 2 n=1 Tax=Dunaliella salina TaxID=3046 RepID=A0ABQ7H7Y5_DUNSA|nr:NUC091 domain-containing protein [Dunaliella salina]|eukprot:KAF5842967.1 NUC091 domain-containing protein [Dunaliella salina]